MDQTLEEALEAADLKTLIPRLILYGDQVIVRKMWRGHKLGSREKGQLLADSKSADDFVKEALEKLLESKRAYRGCESLETNWKGVIESLIWNWKKKSDLRPFLDRKLRYNESGEELDPVAMAADKGNAGSSVAEANEIQKIQQQFLSDFKKHISSDQELTDLLEAYDNGFEKPAEIETLTGIAASRVSELKRKLEMKARKFAASLDREELEAKVGGSS